MVCAHFRDFWNSVEAHVPGGGGLIAQKLPKIRICGYMILATGITTRDNKNSI